MEAGSTSAAIRNKSDLTTIIIPPRPRRTKTIPTASLPEGGCAVKLNNVRQFFCRPMFVTVPLFVALRTVRNCAAVPQGERQFLGATPQSLAAFVKGT